MNNQSKPEWVCPKCGTRNEFPLKPCYECRHTPDTNPLGENVPRHPHIPRQGTFLVTVEVNDFLMKTTNIESAIRDALTNGCMKVIMVAEASIKATI